MRRLVFTAMTCRCELLAECSPAQLRQAESRVRRMAARLTRFDRDSELCAFNDACGRWVDVSPELESLLRLGLSAWEQSGGLVHAGCLAAAAAPGPLPPLPEMLEVRGHKARLSAGGIDLGGLAKGWLADRVAASLGRNALANLGGDLFALGPGPAGQGWPVRAGAVTLLLRDQGAATSGTWKRAWGPGSQHLVDPRTGQPAGSDLTEVSVVAHSATEAEILAKEALLRGRAAAPAALRGRALAWHLGRAA
ncbi:MAG: FAD:protein FMN transferase [Candidatus Dormibacteria bacterium]